jgi:hypothetical protein
MTDRQRAKLKSFLALITVCEKPTHRALWNALIAFTTVFDQFRSRIALIDAYTVVQSADRSGITRQKAEATRLLIDLDEEIAGALVTYGMLTGDHALREKARMNRSDVEKLPDTDIDDHATMILEAARALPSPAPAGRPSPADMGITPGKLDTLATRIETYNLLLGSPRAARGEISNATRGIETAIAEADELAKDGLDKLMLQFRGTDFFNEYQSARKIVDQGSRGSGDEAPTRIPVPPSP